MKLSTFIITAVCTVTVTVVSTYSAMALYFGQTTVYANPMSLSHVSTVRFNANGGSGSMADTVIALGHGYKLPASSITKTGYTLSSWNTASGGSGISIAPGGSADLLPSSETATTLYAQWTANKYTVSYSANGGSGTAPASQSCQYDTQYAAAANTFTRTNHIFLKWNTSSDGSGTDILPGAKFKNLSSASGGTVTLYAVWEDESSDIIEAGWKKSGTADTNGNGKADALELKPGGSIAKDPSLKNHTSVKSYAYILLRIPAGAAKMSGDSSYKVYDLAKPVINTGWTLVKSIPTSSAGSNSLYIYRYNRVLEASGSTASNPDNTVRHMDRTSDLFSSFSIPAFTSVSSFSGSIGIAGCLVNASASTADADKTAYAAFEANGLV